MNKDFVFILSIILFATINFIIKAKALSKLKEDYQKKYIKYLLNFDLPSKKEFEITGWHFWLLHIYLGITFLVLFLFTFFFFIVD